MRVHVLSDGDAGLDEDLLRKVDGNPIEDGASILTHARAAD